MKPTAPSKSDKSLLDALGWAAVDVKVSGLMGEEGGAGDSPVCTVGVGTVEVADVV